MTNDNLSTKKTKDDENNDLKGRHISTRGSTSLGVTAPESSGLRKSSREMTSKKNMIPSPPSTRKSERLEKLTTTTPQVTRKSERAEKLNMLSPLRRSERGKKLSSSSSSGSKKSDRTSGSSDIKQKKERKEKSVKQLTMETKKVNKSEKQDEKPVRVNKKRMDARAYKALFKQQPKKVNASDHHQELNMIHQLSQGCGSNCRDSGSKKFDGGIDCSHVRGEDLEERCVEIACDNTLEGSNSSASESAEKRVEINVGAVFHSTHSIQKHSCTEEANGSEDGEGMKVPKYGATARETSDDDEKARVDCSAQKNMQTPQLVDRETGLERGDGVIMLSKRKRNTVNMDSDAYAVVASEDTHTSIADAITSSPSGCKSKNHPETCSTCFKRQRVDYHPAKQVGGPCNTKENLLIKENNDRGELEAVVITGLGKHPNDHMQQYGSSMDGQTNGNQNTCFVCKLGGKLLCCEGSGCKRSYHLFCLDPPFEHVPLGAWYCLVCVQKKIHSGVHSVSEGVESIWDTREAEVSNDDGLQRQKQYFVKFKGLAHVHNQWVPESKLLVEAASLIAKFNRKPQAARWKQEWTVPHRLLQKRLLTTPKQQDEYHNGHTNDNPICHYEWLVKWCGLDYEHASWELETASLFNSPKGQSLIGDYENRREKAKRPLIVDKTHDRKKDLLVDLSQFSAGGSSALDNYLDFVNKLHSHWHKVQNAVVYDDQVRIMKVIAFILSLSSNVCRPFLVISTSAALYSWDDEFLRLAPSVDVVVYNGSKEIRESIRTLEFYEERGWIMFQVLIISPEVLSEDLDVFECIGWEAIIVDECQSTRISTHFEQIKMLSTNFRILLVSSRLKDTSSEYLNMLSLLESPCDINDTVQLAANSNDNIVTLKERFAKYIVYGCKSGSSRFVEYWVPVQISNVQLEQYCATLLSNSPSLRSSLKNDLVGGLSNTLISIRKCCDHPYIVDESLQSLINKDLKVVEYLDAGIKASGKLQLLDAMLKEIRNQGLRVLVLFQPIGGSGRDLIGDILDDFLRQRFGPDSYERVDRDLLSSKKHSATNKFNKESGRFVFLLETRACHCSIKLSSVDTVIIFDSSWSPVNDLRALQKLTFDSKFEQMKIFRLYSSCTIEEKVLILAKQNKIVDNNPQNISRGTNHMLLMWGASYLFDKLVEFHSHSSPASSTSMLFGQSLLEDVVQEFLTTLTQNGEDNDARKVSLILKAKQNQGTYSTNFPLFGEPKVKLMDEDLPHIFWTKLLEGKRPHWKYCTVSSQRNRKRVQYFDVSQKKLEVENDEVVKKRKKVVSDSADPPSLKPRLQEGMVVGERDKGGTLESPAHVASQSLPRLTSCINDTIRGSHASTLNHLANNISKEPGVMLGENDGGRKLRESQKNLYVLLKPEIAKLCEVLHLSEDVRGLVEKFLEYVMNNHFVNREPATILQAFQISLCWTAASLLKHKIDHKESLALAKEHLNFSCKNEEAYYVYSLLRCLKKVFLCRTGNLKLAYSPKASEQSAIAVDKDHPDARLSQATFDPQMVEVEDGNQSRVQKCYTKQTLSESALALDFQLAQKDLSKSIKEIQKKCQKQMKKLLQKQMEEKEEFVWKYEEEKAKLENKKKMEAVVIRVLTNIQMRTDKLKKLDREYATKFEELKNQMDIRLKNLEAMQVAARNKVLEKEAIWVEGVRKWAQNELVNPPLTKPSFPEVQCPDKLVNITPGSGMRSSETNGNIPDVVVACSDPIDRVIPLVRTSAEIAELDTMASGGASDTGVKECNRAGCSGDGQENVVSVDPSSKEQTPVGAMSDGEALLDVSEIGTSNDHPEDALLVTCSSQQQICDGPTLSMPNGDIPLEAPGTVGYDDGLENVVSVEAHSSVDKIPGGATLRNGENTLTVPETLSSAEGPENIVSLDSPLSEDQFPDGATSPLPDGDISLGVPEIVGPNVDVENVISVSPPSSGDQVPTLATSFMPDGEFPEEVPEAVPNELVRGCNTSGENCGASTVAFDNAIGMGQLDGESCVLNQESHFQELFLMDTTLVQPVSTSGQGGSMPSNQALQDACSLPSTSAGTQVGDAATIEVEPPLSHPVDSEASDQSNREGPVISDQALQDACSLPSTSAVIQVGDAATVETQNISLLVEPPLSHPVDSVASDQSNHEAQVIDTGVQMKLLPPRDPPSNHYLPAASGCVHLPTSEGIIVNQVAQASGQLVENHIELSNQAALQPPTRVAVHPPTDTSIGVLVVHAPNTRTASACSSNNPLQTAIPPASRMPLPLYRDPLQIEVERIRKETDKIVKNHEEMKMLLISDCEKEIEEAVSQIRRKYEVKHQEEDAEFLPKKKVLDANHNKVLMNKILAEAFRSKCMDIRTSGAPGMQQEMASSFMQRLVQLSIPAQRPSIVTDLSSAGLPAANPQTVATPVGRLQTASSPVASPHVSVPLLQAVHYPSALASVTPTRPPPPTGTPQLGREIRAPAPHLQRFRPSTDASSLPALSHEISSTSNPPATSPSFHQHPTRVPPSGTYNRAHRPETTGGLHAHQNSYLSAVELLLDVANQARSTPNLPNSLPLSSDLGLNLDPLVQPQSAPVNSIRANPVQTSGTTDVVCLSDDD